MNKISSMGNILLNHLYIGITNDQSTDEHNLKFDKELLKEKTNELLKNKGYLLS
jgi:hypothetical protein